MDKMERMSSFDTLSQPYTSKRLYCFFIRYIIDKTKNGGDTLWIRKSGIS